MQIIPAVLEKNPEDFTKQINKLSPYFNHFQIDIADGKFVPNTTVQIEDIISAIEQYNNIAIKQLIFDFHLMVQDYEAGIKLLAQQQQITIKNVFIHYSLFPKYEILDARYSPITIGLVINPQDQIEDLARQYDLKKIKAIQIMSIDPGFQGQPFLPDTLNKIEQLRNLSYGNKIYLDGAVNEKTIPVILSKKFKPDILCVGSFFTKAESLTKNIGLLTKLLHSKNQAC